VEKMNTGITMPGTTSTSRKTIIAIAIIIAVASAFSVGYFASPSKTSIITSTTVTQTATSSDSAGTSGQAATTAASAANPLKSIWTTQTAQETGPTPTVTAEDFSNRMIVYSATISLKVEKIDSTIISLQQLTVKCKGYIASVYTGTEDGSVTIRVPQAVFYDAVEEIRTLGKVQGQNVNGEDVSEKYVDLQAQLTNQVKQEARLREILGLAKTVAEVMTVEQELTRVRGAIESLTGEINYLNSRVEFASITISLNQSPVKQSEWMPQLDLTSPMKTGAQILFTLVEGMLVLIVALGPFAVLIAGIVFAYRRIQVARSRSGNPPKANP
jgi:hypothetical protein